ncbi:MAG: DMT family transporter [Candidatus Daviesbacteria bacterium]|nr:DMT family transporter [Candidatus Daviesbacteria bacterium]
MWFFYSIVFALVSSVGPIIAKKVMAQTGEYIYIWLASIFTLPFLFFSIVFFYQIPRFDQIFLWSVAGTVFLDVVAAILAYKAIKISEISLIAPLAAFNPVFTAIISFFTLGEILSIKDLISVLIICIGAYTLQISSAKKGLLDPVKNLISNKGVQYSMIAYLIWAITPTLQKTAIGHTYPQIPPFASFAGLLGTTILYSLMNAKLSKNKLIFVREYFLIFIIVGILGTIASISAFTAFSLANLAQVTAIFKLSMIFSVIFGWLFFKEPDIKNKLIGSSIMLLGVYLLSI